MLESPNARMLESPNARMLECPNALTPREATRRTGHAVPHRRNARLRKVHRRAQGEGRRSYGRDPRVLGNALKGLISRNARMLNHPDAQML